MTSVATEQPATAAPVEQAARLGPDERAALGRAARRTAPRSAHAEWERPRDAEDPLAILARQAEGRVPDLVPIRHARMLTSPFAFFRGAAAVMAADLAGSPASGLTVQACGDAHLANFGVYAAPDRRLVFDLNDFDETLRAPWEWDVKRLAASIAVAGRHRGIERRRRREIVEAAASAYRRTMTESAGLRDIDLWYRRTEVDALVDQLRERASDGMAHRARRGVEKARRRDSLRALERLTVTGDDAVPRIRSDPPLLIPLRDLVDGDAATVLTAEIRALLASYRATLRADVRHLADGYRLVDIAHKVVGVGSVGLRCWVVLLTGRDDRDALFLQAKEASASVLEPYVVADRPEHQGRRVVEGQRLMQATSDVLLGWVAVPGEADARRDFYVRQLWDAKASVDLDTIRPAGLRLYAELCGATLARAHARTGDRIAIAAYLGGSSRFDRAMVEFAETYADRNEADHAAFADAVARGEVVAATDA